MAKECGEADASATRRLPNSALALQQRKKIKILAIGASSAAVLGMGRDGSPPLLEQILERTIKGLDVEIINRGFSGELAEAAGERLKIEVALNHPDIVLWQVGTNDAFAQVPVESFQLSVSNAVRWLKAHNIDVILVGLHYMKQLAKDEHYQAIRTSLRRDRAPPRTCCASGATRPWRCSPARCRRAGQPEPQDFGLTRGRLQLHGAVYRAHHHGRPVRQGAARTHAPSLPGAAERCATPLELSALRGLEARRHGLLLGAEPALAAGLLHARALVVRRPRQHVGARRARRSAP